MHSHLRTQSIHARDRRLSSSIESSSRPVARLLPRMPMLLSLVSFFAATGSAVAGERSQSIVVRLLTPVASYSPRGTRFNGRVIGPVLRDTVEILPNGSTVTGEVQKSASVRFGVRRQRSLLQLEFDGCQLPDGTGIECKVALEAVDNARETVTGNRIDGVLAASHAYNWLSGLWVRPEPALIPRSASGLAGGPGGIYTHLAPTPVGAAAVITARLLLCRLPDPEIELPAGTDLLVRVQVPDGRTFAPQPVAPVPPEVSEWVAAQPDEVQLSDKNLAGDMIHLVLVGSREQVERAFFAAGWSTSEPLTRRSFARMYSAFSSMKAYPTAPVAPLTYRGRTADLVFQKTLNTIVKRHHIRIWSASLNGTQVWLGAATHDTAIAFDWKRMSLTHRIDALIDRERSTVVNHISAAGCAAGLGVVERPHAVRRPDSGRPSATDGNAVLLLLGDCSTPEFKGSELRKPQRRRVTLAVRRSILESRYYLTRGNLYYWTYRAVSLLRKRNSDIEGADE